MKKSIFNISLSALFILAAGCTREDIIDGTPVKTDFSDLAIIQLNNSIVNSNRNFLYLGDTAVNTATIAYGATFPATPYAYSIQPGSRTFIIRDTLRTTTQVPLSFTGTFQPGKRYAIFTYDTITSPKQLIVETDVPAIIDTMPRIRFLNLLYAPSATPVPAVDVFSFLKNQNVVTNIPIAQITPFINYPSATDTFYIREAGTAIQLAKLTVSYTKKRGYTVVVRGRYKGGIISASSVANY